MTDSPAARFPRSAFGPPSDAERERVLTSGPFLELDDAAARLSVTPQAVEQAIAEGRLFAFRLADGRRFVPEFLVDGRHDPRLLEQVIRALGPLSPSLKYQFFVTRWGTLGDLSPLEALARGCCIDVVDAARAYAAPD